MSEPLSSTMPQGSPVRLQGIQNVNLNLSGPQQFVIASPVSLQQMQLPTNNTGVSRFLNLSQRGGIGGDASCMSFVTLSSGSRAAAHPTLVTSLASPARPSQLHSASGSHGSITNHVGRKRVRPQDLAVPTDTVKRRILDAKLAKLSTLRSRYADSAAELFFLQAGGCLIDFPTWRIRRSTHQLQAFLQSHRLDPTDKDEDLSVVLSAAETDGADAAITPAPPSAAVALPTSEADSVSESVTRPSADLSPYKSAAVTSRPHSLSGMYDASLGSQELIAERVKQEAYVAQRISELQREGLWAEKRLPKVQEPPRSKAHWDYLLEEMTWLCADFNQERKWKKANAKKCAKMVQKYFLDKESLQRKEEKSQELKLRRLANFMAKEVKNFWANVNKLVEYKQTTRLEEKRKKALDQHLSFIVDQTEKYSTWLAESMNKTGGQTSASTSRPASPRLAGTAASDEEFQPNVTSSDDEETIAKEDEREADEVERLKNESEIPLEDLLDQLPKDYFLNRDQDLSHMDSGSTKSEDLTVDDADETDKVVDRSKAVELKNKGISKYEKSSKSAAERDSDDDETASESEESAQSETEAGSDDSAEDDVSLKTLVENKLNKGTDGEREQANKEINDVTAIAESLQPKGSTLLTANVVTTVPFLVKHTLREYQHIGLDWLVTMFDRKLNGILADEMGLGKTIQTIALLAHLACDKGNWGPHLIIVPTSVMLNWEMEFKKWCPAFKILTYYGTIKERKAKRSGWTKANAFHICITSYKLVIQDHQSFRRKKWQYLVLDEAQNIKNFRSQRWQLLLNFQTARRLLLTGTPLQNNLMELWSLMHFLMPHVFQSHREFKEWFSNPVTGMLEGNTEYNESIIKRLHKVLRPFLLRRLKTEVEKQLPKKYEHVVMCRLSKRQRYLYDDFMSRAKTKETLESGNLLSVINVLMQLRKVCNHPNLFEVRPVISPFQMEGIDYRTASLVTQALDYDPNRHVDLDFLNLRLVNAESMTALGAFMTWRLKAARRLIGELDEFLTADRPRPPKCALHLDIQNSFRRGPVPISAPTSKNSSRLAALPPVDVGRSPCMRLQDSPAVTPLKVSGSEVHLIPGVKQARLPVHLVQTSTGRHIYFPLQSASANSVNAVIANGQRLSLGPLKNPQAQPTGHTQPAPVSEGSESDVDILGTTAVTKTLTVTVKRLSPTLVTRSSESEEVTSPLPLSKSLVEERRRARRQARLRSLAAVHERRCERYPVYGTDTVSRFRFVDEPPSADSPAAWRWRGSAACLVLASPRLSPQNRLWGVTDALASAVKGPEQLLTSLHDILSKFIVYVPAVNAPTISIHVSHPPPSRLWRERRTEVELVREMAPRCRILHPIARSMATQFPDPRLIQYDCGKLQVLDRLLRQLKADHHKVLLFTQMTRMLDVLEAFLNYHGYIYLRLDGTTKVDQRQVLMERFNTDARIFVFILSTRSGGIGVNLTGADTVIFYDSDWNPTMDAQAQDRCHRIGQTRDVHIYRLVSEMTVEENILKKANQKRLLGDLAIEGGNFTTAYFKSKSTIQDLFNVDTSETDANKRMRQSLGGEREKRGTDEADPSGVEKVALGALESALATAEDAPDVEAARTATAEAAAELAEFDENIPLEDTPEAPEQEMSRAEMEVEQLVQQLKPIERYAMRYVEENEAAWSAEQLAAAEAQIEEQKREWELNRQAAMEAEEARLREDEDADAMTYGREPCNEVWLNERSMEGIAMWCPPTPPQELDDVYIDKNLRFLYQEEALLDSELPPVYIKKELKRSRTAEIPSNLDMRRSMKMSRRDDSPMSAPRSLFDHPSSALQKMRRDVKMHKYRGLSRPVAIASPAGAPPVRLTTPTVRDENAPEWLVHEDWALLQAVELLQELPLNLFVLKPGHTPNWDLVADMVNQVSCYSRSPAQCRNRYEAIIIPREEGKLIQEQKKQKKTKNMYKLPTQKTNRALRTAQLNIQDNNMAFTEAYHQRFDNIKSLVLSRKPNPKPLLVNPSMKNPKHFAVLTESGIVYDTPVNPIEIATRRADRIAKDKKIQAMAQVAQAQAVQAVQAVQSTQAAQAGHSLTADQLTAQQRQLVVAANSTKVAQTTSVQVPAATVNVAVSLGSGVVGTAQVLSGVSVGSAASQGVTQTHTQSIVVPSGTALTAIQTAGITTLTPTLRQARPVTTLPVALQEMVVAANQARTGGSSGTSTTATVVSVANLTQAQLQAARLASGSLVTLPTSSIKAGGNTVQMASGAKTLSPAQMSYYRQQTLMRAQPQQRIGIRDPAQVKVVPGQAKVTQVASLQPASPSQPKAQYLKQTAALTAKGRQEEVAALVKQQLQRHQKAQQSTLTAQFLTSTGLQVQGSSPQVATLVKASATGQNVTIPLPGIAVPQVKGTLASQLKTTVAGTQQMRLGLPATYQQLLNKQTRPAKVTQLTKPNMSAVPTQLIVQSQGGKAVPTINMQHIHQVIKNAQPQHITVSVAPGQGVTSGGQVVLAKASTAGGGTLGPRVLPAVGGARQTIQVVPGTIRGVPGVAQVSVSSPLSSALAGSLKVSGTSQQAFISQVAGLPSIVRQGVNPVRIQTSTSGTPIMAVTVQQQQSQQSSDHSQGQS